MKKNVINILFITALSLSVFSCKDKAKEAITTEAETPARHHWYRTRYA